jgi:flagellar basal-body rod modification protein FlgD
VSVDENTFLTLLVAQLKNQDPLSPQDGTQFVSQLAQFSQLEQLIGINKNTASVAGVVAPPPTADSGGAAAS